MLITTVNEQTYASFIDESYNEMIEIGSEMYGFLPREYTVTAQMLANQLYNSTLTLWEHTVGR